MNGPADGLAFFSFVIAFTLHWIVVSGFSSTASSSWLPQRDIRFERMKKSPDWPELPRCPKTGAKLQCPVVFATNKCIDESCKDNDELLDVPTQLIRFVVF